MCSPNYDMGTGTYMGGGLLYGNNSHSQHPSLPHRRYSVPETVMRKYTLSRQQSADSCDSEIATVPTPSVSSNEMSAPTDNTKLMTTDILTHYSKGRKRRNIPVEHKACQTSPPDSTVNVRHEIEVTKPSIGTVKLMVDVIDNKIDDSDSIISTNLEEKQWEQNVKDDSAEDSSTKEIDNRQIYYSDKIRESEMINKVTLPGEVVVEQDNHAQPLPLTDGPDLLEEQEHLEEIADDDKLIEVNIKDECIVEEDVQLLLDDITKQKTIKIFLGVRANSFPENSNIDERFVPNLKRVIKSANGRLLRGEFSRSNNRAEANDIKTENNNETTEMDSAILEEDTPSPAALNSTIPSSMRQHQHGNNNGASPPKSGHSSESAECYITDCDICNAEGRKCCSLDDSSEVCSFTSPDMVITTNELKTSSEFTSTSITLYQTVSDRSTSTQDSTLSITSITPESYSSSSAEIKLKLNGGVSPTSMGLVISSETAILDPIKMRESTKNLSFHLSDSNQSESQSDGTESSRVSAKIPLVLTSESVLMEPIKCDETKKMHCVLEMMETDDSTLTETTVAELQKTELTDEEINNNIEEHLLDNTTEDGSPDKDGRNVEDIFVNRNVEHRQSLGSVVMNGDVRQEAYSRSMSCGELPTNYGTNFCGTKNGRKSSVDGDEEEEEEGDLLEKLGFKEEPKSGRTSSSFLELCGGSSSSKKEMSYEEMCKKQVNDMFYGNRTYEVISSNTDIATPASVRKTIMGNVMSTSEENIKMTQTIKRILQNSTDRQNAEVNVNTDNKNVNFNVKNNNRFRRTEEVFQDDFVCDGKCKNNEADEEICGNVIMLRVPFPEDEDGKTITTCLEAPIIENYGKELIIPRYSAKPRTASMVVNTSSADYSSDSDLSLPDSLEEVTQSQEETTGLSSSDQQADVSNNNVNKHDDRMVRGHVMSLLPENTKKLSRQRTTEAYAYFVSLSGETGEIKTESIPENLKRKLMKRDGEIKRHADHHFPRREKCYESIFRRPARKKTPKLSKPSQSESYDYVSSKDEAYYKRRAYSLTSDDSEEISVDQESKSTQWEEFPEPVKKLQIQDEQDVLKKTKESKWLKCAKLLKPDPEIDKIVSEVLLTAILLDKQEDEADEQIKDILLEALRQDEEDENLRKEEEEKLQTEEEKSTDSNEEQVVPSKNSSPDLTISNDGSESKYKSICVQTSESALHSYSTCTTFETCDICNEINGTKGKGKNEEDDNKNNEDKVTKISEELNTKDVVDKSKEQTQKNNMKTDLKSKLPSKSVTSQKHKLEVNLLKQKSKKVVNQSRDDKAKTDTEKIKTPTSGRTPVALNNKISPRTHLNVYNTGKQQNRVKIPTLRRPGNLNGRFRQKFEAIPEERSGSVESSEDQTKSPKVPSGRRASLPATDLLLMDASETADKKKKKPSEDAQVLVSGGSSSSSGNGTTEIKGDSSDIRQQQIEDDAAGPSSHSRRHTVHGNISINDDQADKEKIEQSRRHTVHGNIGLGSIHSTGRINLNVGSIMKGRVIGKRGNVMIGRFHPVGSSEETQVEKDEKLLIGKIERIRKEKKERYKGRDALTTSRSSEHDEEELLTLSKGWINFYLLRESMDIGGSDASDNDVTDSGSELIENSEQYTTSVQNNISHRTVTVVGKPDREDHIRHQYTVQIQATEEQLPQPPVSPLHLPASSHSDTTKLPHITNSPVSSPSPTSNGEQTQSVSASPSASGTAQSLPQLHSERRSILKQSKYKTSKKYTQISKEPGKDERLFSPPSLSDQQLEYLHLPVHKLDNQSPSGDSMMTPSCDTESDSMSESPVLPSIRWPVRQVQRSRHQQYNTSVHRYQRTETSRLQHHVNTNQLPPPPQPTAAVSTQNGGTCWTVTVAGNSGYPQQPPPDVEMRLSFAANVQQKPLNGQTSDQTPTSATSSHHEMKHKRLRRALQNRSPQPCWSLTVKNKNEEDDQDEKGCLPGVGQYGTGPGSQTASKPVFSRKDVGGLRLREQKGVKRRSRGISPLSGQRLRRS